MQNEATIGMGVRFVEEFLALHQARPLTGAAIRQFLQCLVDTWPEDELMDAIPEEHGEPLLRLAQSLRPI